MDESLQSKIKRRGELINELNEWMSTIGSALIESFRKEQKEDLYNLANDLYWQDVELSTINLSMKGIIRDVYLGVTGERFKPKKMLDVFCPACGEQIEVTSGSQMKEMQGKDWSHDLDVARNCCNDCFTLQLEKTHRPHNVIVYPNPVIHKNVKTQYSEFLNSDYWIQVREYIKQKDGGECVLCGSRENLHVHHKNYQHRGYEFKNDLHTLCGKCHRKYHNIQEQER